MKYATCNFDYRQGYVRDDDGSLEWHNGTLEEAMSYVKTTPGSCALFFPNDIPEHGRIVYPKITREDFEAEPALYGACYFKGLKWTYI